MHPPKRGTLVNLGAPRLYVEPSVRMILNVGATDSHAMLWDPQPSTIEPYFPNRTITLKKDEQHVLVIDLYPPPGQLCRPQLEMTVIHRDKEYKQNVVPEDQRTGVMGEEPAEAEQEYSQVYLGGYICRKYVLATPDGVNECGPEGKCEIPAHVVIYLLCIRGHRRCLSLQIERTAPTS